MAASLAPLVRRWRPIMWRRFLLLLLCAFIPLQSVKADIGALAHAWGGAEVVALGHGVTPHHHHHHHAEAAEGAFHQDNSPASAEHMSDHCLCPLGWLLPSLPSVLQRGASSHAVPEWTPPALPAPTLAAPQRPPHPAG